MTMILTNQNRLGTDWHLAASIRSVCSMNFNNLFHHFPGCGELPQYGVSDDDYGPLPPPSPSLTPEIKAIVGELLVSIKERVIGYPFRKFEDEIIDPERLYLDDVLENLHSDMYDNMDDVSKALSTVIDDGWRGGTISVKARRGEVATFSPKEMSFFVKTIRKTYSKVHDKIVEDAAIETSPDTNNNDDAIIINSGLEDTSDARLSAAQPPVLNMQEISRDILGLGGDQQRPSSQIISIGGENYLLPQEPLPIPDVQEANTILNMPIIVHDETEARDSTGCLTPSVSRTPQNLVKAASAPTDYITVNVDSTDTTVSFSYAFLDTGPRKRKGSPMEASVSPKKVAREPVSPCSKESRGGRVEPLDSEPATQKIVTNNYDMPILSSPQLSTSLSPELEPMDTVSPLQAHVHTEHGEGEGEQPAAPGLQCPVCGEAAWSSASALQTHVDTHFTSPEAGPSTTADLQLARDMQLAIDMQLQETQRRRREEEAQFASLRAQYGMDEQGNYVQQSDAGLWEDVTRGRLSVTDYYERSQAVAQAELRGADEGSSVTRSVAGLVRAQAGAAQLHTAANTDHYASSYGDKGWGCGYRNLQMVLSCLLHKSHFRDVLAANILCNKNNITMPSISKLQKLIEDAWQEGFDKMGYEQLGGRLVNTRKWIGSTEIFTFLSYCGIDCEIVDFHRPSSGDGSHPAMFQWLLNYFRGGGGAACPVYLQHQGHSRTVLGVETAGAAINLLVLDPSHSPTSVRSDQLMRLVRKPLGSMKSNQYQLVAVRGVITSPELRETKKIVKSTSPQYGLQSCGFPGSEGRPSGDRDKERDRDRDKECGENGARPRELDSKDSTTNNVISIPDTDDMANIEIISKGQLLLDSMEFPERKCRKVAMEQRRQRQIRDQQSLSNLPLFPDAWTEENNRALKTSRKRAFGEDLGWSGGGGAAVPPLLELQGVPHPPQRRQLLQLPHPHRQVEIPLDIHHKMQDPRREDTQQLPEILYLYE